MSVFLPVAGAFLVVAGMLWFLAWCGREFDAESEKVARGGGR